MESNENPKSDTFGTLLKWGAGAFVAWKVLSSEPGARFLQKLDQVAKELAAAERRKKELEFKERFRQFLTEYSKNQQLSLNTGLPSQVLTLPTSGEDANIPSVAKYTKEVDEEPDSNWRKRLSALPRSSFLANAGAVNLPWHTAFWNYSALVSQALRDRGTGIQTTSITGLGWDCFQP